MTGTRLFNESSITVEEKLKVTKDCFTPFRYISRVKLKKSKYFSKFLDIFFWLLDEDEPIS